MSIELTTEKIREIDSMLGQGLRLRRIATVLRVSESTLRWKLANAGYRVESAYKLVPIHAPALEPALDTDTQTA